MPVGTSLFAARAGTVIARGTGFLGVTVDGAAQEDWYLHISASVVALGWHVARKQPIALSGSVRVPGGPMPTGPHLHFEVQTGALDVFATSLDPVPVLTGLYGAGAGGFDLTPEEHQMLTDIHGAFGTAANQTLGSILNEIKAKLDAINGVTLSRIEAEVLAVPGGGGLSALQAQALADIHDAIMRMETALKGA